ncbi:hypothetical protein D8S78_07080 [Natrialba swarupiae]|nr:hypothetical protein [Natrialba swarupiae]
MGIEARQPAVDALVPAASPAPTARSSRRLPEFSSRFGVRIRLEHRTAGSYTESSTPPAGKSPKRTCIPEPFRPNSTVTREDSY